MAECAGGTLTLPNPWSVAFGTTGATHALLLLVRVGPCLDAALGDVGPLPRRMSRTVNASFLTLIGATAVLGLTLWIGSLTSGTVGNPLVLFGREVLSTG